MIILKIEKNKERYADLLLMADEEQSMINKYLNRGGMRGHERSRWDL